MKARPFHHLSVSVLPAAAALLLRLWFATCRVAEHGSEHRRQAEKFRSVIALFWHHSLFYVFYHLRADRAAVLVSASEDGDYIARLAHRLDFETVRGSSNRRGLLALKELMACLERGTHVGMVGDGSQGPPLQLQAGSVLLASKTGAPVLPMTWSASHSLNFRSWDRTCLPLPFARVDFFYGEPLSIPADLDRDAVERYRLELEQRLNGLYRQAWSCHGREKHDDA